MSAYVAKGGGLGGGGGGSLEAVTGLPSGLDLPLKCRHGPEPPGAPWGGASGGLGRCQEDAPLSMLQHSHSIHMPFSNRKVTF